MILGDPLSERRQLAAEMRDELGISPEEPFDPWAYAALCGHTVTRLSDLGLAAANYFVNDRGGKFSGAVIRIGTGYAILDNDGQTKTRRRSTMCHELAHIELAHEFEHVAPGESRRCGMGTAKEDEADRLAGELLVPYSTALQFALAGLSDAEVAQRMHISESRARQQMNQSHARRDAALRVVERELGLGNSPER